MDARLRDRGLYFLYGSLKNKGTAPCENSVLYQGTAIEAAEKAAFPEGYGL
jgi:hypothetical protein